MPSETSNPELISLAAAAERSAFAFALKPAAKAVERALGIRALNALYAEYRASAAADASDANAFERALRALGVRFAVASEAFDRIPRDGPAILVANHPFGGIDGVALGALLQAARPDGRLMGNYLLSRIEGIADSIIQVDPFERTDSWKANLRGARAALGWLKRSGCLAVFPAGEVSSLRSRAGAVVDRPWSPQIVHLALRAEAPIVPVYFAGRNSALFQLAGIIHPLLRTALLPREMLARRGAELHPRIGAPIPASRLRSFASAEAAADYLRLQTYLLKDSAPRPTRPNALRFPFPGSRRRRREEPVPDPVDPDAIETEIETLPPDRRLAEQGDWVVLEATAGRIPNAFAEIARLREITFRAVGEGTGRATDRDSYDAYYRHLFLWDRRERRIVGAYRLGPTDEIRAAFGASGLYTSTLFHFKSGFWERLGTALELGRSFIRPEYQRKHASLALLWRGIGAFVARNPRYRTLFGPVSFTDAYQPISKNLMVHFLRERNFDEELAPFVRARKSPESAKRVKGISVEKVGAALDSIDAVSAVVSGFEQDRKGIPILLRHYLKLNGALLSFNVDPAFSNVIDGLIVVDLARADERLVRHYMGRDGCDAFKSFHAASPKKGAQ